MKQIFNDHQYRLWRGMLQTILDYRAGKIRYSEMVGNLEGALDAGEFQDMNLRGRWYDLWTPLEIARATGATNLQGSETRYVSEMQKFLEEVLDTATIASS